LNRIGLRLALIILVILGGIASFYFLPIKFGLDLAGGVHFTLEAVDTPGAPLTKEGVQAAQRVISQRVNAMGLAEPIIQGQSGDKWNRIIVDLPGYQDPARAREILQRTAVLEFIVAREKVTITASDLTSTTTQGETLTPTIIVEPRSQIPMILVYYGPDGQKKYAIVGTNSGNEPGFETLEKAQQTITPTPGLKLELPRGEVALTGKYLVDARARYGQSGEAEVAIKFNDEGTRLFAQLTKEMVRKMIYTVLDNDIVFAGTVQEEIPSGEARLTGRFSIDEASNIATLLRGGALPVKLVIAEERTVAPTLGKAAIDASLIAGIIAVILIALFMILNYRFLGFLADITLAIYVLLVIALMKALGAVLTLPGIAGIILSIGMAVDANVLIFERIREEIRSGKTFRGALSVGFSRAFRTVVDSNATTLIAAFALYWFGTGSIRGFAITLSLGILVSLFTAVFVTKVFLDLLSGTKLSHNYPLLNIHERAFSLIRVGNWNIIGKTKLWFTISLVLIIIGVAVAFVNVGVREQKLPLNLGVDFTGGSRLELTTEGDDQLVPSTLKSALATQGLPDSQIQPINEHDVVVRTKELTSEDTNRIMEGLKETFPSIKLVAADYVGPVVGKDLQLNALYAVLVALLGIVIYISIRFQFRYAVATIIALVHDVLIVLGFFAVSFLEANSPLVAVLLTVVGYSVMDTVVTLDRIRENMRFRKREPISEVINRSILQTFTRSMNTTLTTLLAVLSLVIFGGRSILDFSAGLFVGLATGAYSSFFIATPILNIWLNRAELKERARIKSKKK
jgi:SecD/SecF fusion protein